MRDFLWDGVDRDLHCQLVAWEHVCKPKDRGLGNWEHLSEEQGSIGEMVVKVLCRGGAVVEEDHSE